MIRAMELCMPRQRAATSTTGGQDSRKRVGTRKKPELRGWTRGAEGRKVRKGRQAVPSQATTGGEVNTTERGGKRGAEDHAENGGGEAGER